MWIPAPSASNYTANLTGNLTTMCYECAASQLAQLVPLVYPIFQIYVKAEKATKPRFSPGWK